MMRRFILALFLTCVPAAAVLAAYCGQFTTNNPTPPPSASACSFGPPATANWPGCADAKSCGFYVAATGGSDSNSGSVNAPFATLEKAQTVMQGQGVAASKITCLKAGTYARSSPIHLSSADNGETWQFDPAGNVNQAVLDCGHACDFFIFGGSANGITINGIKMQNSNDGAIYDDGTNTLLQNITIENNEMASNNHTNAIGGFNPMVVLGNSKNTKYLHNYVHDTASQGLALYAFNAGQTVDGSLIDSNVVIRSNQVQNDGGAIYVNMRNSNITAGHATISNNFVRDYGHGVEAEGIYLDDDASNIMVSGNVVAPMDPTATANSASTIVNGGTNNTFQNNIFDVGSTSHELVGRGSGPGDGGAVFFSWGSLSNIWQNNIIVANYAGSTATVSGDIAYLTSADYPTANGAVRNNMYHNFGGGEETTVGNVLNDSSPVHQNPSCSGYLDSLNSNSPAFAAPVSFLPIAGNWGPPGFVIPTSTNHSCP